MFKCYIIPSFAVVYYQHSLPPLKKTWTVTLNCKLSQEKGKKCITYSLIYHPDCLSFSVTEQFERIAKTKQEWCVCQ